MLTITRAIPARDEDMSASVYTAEDDGKVVGRGGLAWGAGRCWLWLEVYESKPEYARTVIREGRRLLRMAQALGHDEVYTPRDAQYETSAKLLKHMGFEATGEMIDGREIYVCQV
jgi:hypothetical protein